MCDYGCVKYLSYYCCRHLRVTQASEQHMTPPFCSITHSPHFLSFMPAHPFLFFVDWSDALTWADTSSGRAVFLNSASPISIVSLTCVSREIEASLRDCRLPPRSLFAYVTGSEFGLLQQRRLKMRFSYYSLFHQYSQSVNGKITDCVYILILKIICQGWTIVGCCFKWHQLDHNPEIKLVGIFSQQRKTLEAKTYRGQTTWRVHLLRK